MKEKRPSPAAGSNVLRAASMYLGFVLIGNLVWEFLHLPLYTIWQGGALRQQAIAVAHCTVGDVLIAATALLLSLLFVGSLEWPARHFGRVAIVAILVGVGYTAFSEWLNVGVLGSWAYSRLMPVISVGDARIGVSPLLQWSIVPPASFLLTRHYLLGRVSHL